MQYDSDEKTDMFQIGRSFDHAIDFIVLDTCVPNGPPDITSEKSQTTNISNIKDISNTSSTISRYACRICVDREYPHAARIYAAGFDLSKRIFLGVSKI